MKVRCVRLIDALGKVQDKSAWLTIGRIYLVLSIIQDCHHRWLLRVVGDEPNGTALFSLDLFETVTSGIPPTWVASWSENGVFTLGPAPWSRKGFWDRYYDRDLDALKLFHEERQKIVLAELNSEIVR